MSRPAVDRNSLGYVVRATVVGFVCMAAFAMGQTAPPETPAEASAPIKKFAPNRLLVRFRPGAAPQARAQAHQRGHGKTLHRFQTVSNLEVVQLDADTDVRKALKAYRSDPRVLYAEPDYRGHTRDVIPNDPSFSLLWGMRNTGASGGVADADIDATDAWTLSTGSDTVVVGIIDTGLDISHPDLAANVYTNTGDCSFNNVDDDGDGYVDDCNGLNVAGPWNNMYDGYGHGTHVAGTIGAVGNNAVGVTGVNWKVKLLPCRWLDSNGDGYASDAIQCVDYMSAMKDRGVNIVVTNNSWGLDGYSQALFDAIKGEMDRGILFVAAAGNGGPDGIGDNNDLAMDTPSGYPLANVIAVAATTRTDARASFSNYGRHSVHLGAPGLDVYSTYPGGLYQYLSGTSMATPHVVGTIALLSAYNPTWTWTELRNRVLAGGDIKTSMSNTITGRRLNAYGAMTCANRTVQTRVWPATSTVTVAVGEPVTVTVLDINCAAPNGPLSMTINGQTVPLVDDGTGGDQVANDGYYTGQWVPTQPGSFSTTVAGEALTVIALKPYRYEIGNETYRSITGTSLNLSDETSATLTPPFPIHFGGSTFSKLYVNSNGLITLSRAYNLYLAGAMPVLGVDAIVAPYWDDLNPAGGSARNVFWQAIGTAPNRELVIEWRNVAHYPDWTNDGITFQVVFSESKDDVIFNYSDVIFSGGNWGDYGSHAGVGIQVSGIEGTQFSLNQPALQNGMSLRWTTSGPDFDVSLQNASATVYPNMAAAIGGTSKALFGFTGDIDMACGANAPATCTTTHVTPTKAGTPFSITAADGSPGQYDFTIVGTASTDATLTHSVPFTLKVVDFQLGDPTPAVLTVPNGTTSGPVTVPVMAFGPFDAAVTLSCSGLPAGATCAFSPSATVNPTSAAPVNVNVTVTVPSLTTVGDYAVMVSANSAGAPSARTRGFTLTVQPHPDFILSAPASAQSFMTYAADVPVTLVSQDSYGSAVNLSCAVSSPLVACSIPSPVVSYPASVLLHLDPSASGAGNYVVTVSGSDGTITHTATLAYNVSGFAVTSSAFYTTYTGYSNNVPVRLDPVNGYKGTATFSCDATSLGPEVTCYASPSAVNFQYYYWINVGLQFRVPEGVIQGTYPVVLHATDNGTGTALDWTLWVTVKGYTLTRGERFEHTILAGDTSDPFDLIFTPGPGYDLTTALELYCYPRVCTFNDGTPLAPGAPATRTFTAQAPVVEQGTAGGTFTLRPRGVVSYNGYSAWVYSDPFILHVQDYELQSDLGANNTPVVPPGEATQFRVTNQQFNGLDLPTAISCGEVTSPDVTCDLSATVLQPGESATVTLTAAPSALFSQRTLNIHGVAHHAQRDLVHTLAMPFSVGDFKVSVSPSTVTVFKGATATFYATVTAPGTAILACSGLDAGLTCQVSNYFGGNAILAVHTDGAETSVGPHSFEFTATVGSQVRSAALTVIMQGDDGLTLTAPNGGSVNCSCGFLPAGAQTISWKYSGNPGPTLQIELLKHGVPDRLIASGVSIGANGTGSYVWNVPSNIPFATDAQIRITSESQPAVTDTSDAKFLIGTGVIVVSPNGGERLYSDWGTSMQWAALGDTGNVKIELLKTGNVFSTLSDSTNSHMIYPTLSGVPDGSDYRIRVTSLSNAAINDSSDGDFSIKGRPRITITSPNGGENWLPGSTQLVKWTYANIPDNADVKISVGNIPIAVTAPIGSTGSGSYTWNIPAEFPTTTNENAWIYVNATEYWAYDYNDAPFTLGDFRTVTVNKTGGGDGWVYVNGDNVLWPGLNTNTRQIALGSTVTMTMSVSGSSVFTGWSGACTGTGPCTFVVDGNKSVTATFAPPSPYVQVTSPNGGESLNAGTPQTITWNYGNNPGSAVKIELLKGGVLTSTLATAASIGTGGSGFYNWNVSATQATANNYTIRVTSTTVPSATDTSDAPFTILGPGVTVTSPNGGENWQPGTQKTVKWTVRGSIGSLVRIDLYKNGVLNRALSTGASASAGTFTWTVPTTQLQGADYKVRIASTTIASYNDLSDANFSIYPLNLTVTSPNGGEVWRPGSQHSITWTSTGPVGTDVKLELLKAGVLDSVIAASVPVGAGGYAWTIPAEQAHASNYAVRVTSNQNGTVSDASNAAFTIDDLYQVAVTKAGTGLGTVTSSPAGISCGAACAANFSAGTQVTLTATPNAGHTFNGWSGACTGTDACVLGIDGDKAVTATFTAPPTGITVTAPNGGESWNAGTVQTIRWSWSGSVGTLVRVQLYKNGVLNRTISSGTSIGAGGNGVLNWTVPSTQLSGSDYTVRVTSTTNAAYTDASDAAFRIVGPGITVTSPNGGESFLPGTTQTVRWTYTGSVGTAVRVDLYKAGVLNRTLTTATAIGTGGNGAYNWAIATTQALGSDYRIKVTSTTNAAYTDQSDNNFTIANTNVKLVSPNGGETWRPGTEQTVTWTYSGSAGTDVKLELLKGGVVQAVMAAAAPIGSVGAGSYSWTVPAEQAHGSDYAVRITSNQNATLTDASDASFAIDERFQLSVTKQGTGTGTVASSPAGINCGTACTAAFSQGTQVTLTATPTAGHTFDGWSGACTGTGQCVVSMDADQQVTATFTAPAAGITVTAPNGGESLLQGQNFTVRWTYTGAVGTTVKIELLNNGVLNRTLSTGASIGSNGVGAFSTKLSLNQSVGSQYRIRVTSTTSPTATDSSDGDFSIESVQ